MTTDATTFSVAGLRVAVVRKPIKNLHVGVYPPDGRVRVAAPMALSENAIRVAVIGRLPWIKRHRAAFEKQVRTSAPEMVSGESHYYRGRRYRLDVVEEPGPAMVTVAGQRLRIQVRPGATREARARVLDDWYRERLRALLAPVITRWEQILGVDVRRWGIKRMKTKWGSCNPDSRSVWFNLDLVRKSAASLEYVVVHELLHLRVRVHDDRFRSLMDRHLPPWPRRRAELNAGPLPADTWGCSGD